MGTNNKELNNLLKSLETIGDNIAPVAVPIAPQSVAQPVIAPVVAPVVAPVIAPQNNTAKSLNSGRINNTRTNSAFKPLNNTPKPANTPNNTPKSNNNILASLLDSVTNNNLVKESNNSKKQSANEGILQNLLKSAETSINNTINNNKTNKTNNNKNNNNNNNNNYTNNINKTNNTNNTNNGASLGQSVKKSLSDGVNTIVDKLDDAKDMAKDMVEESSLVMTLFKVALATIALIVLVYLGKYLYLQYNASRVQAPYLVDGTKNGKHSLVVSQNPLHTNYIPINKSEDRDGIEFTYQFWILIEDLSYKKGEWKHVFHKGNTKAYPHRAPGVFIHPDKNAIRVYMNTQHNILEHVDVEGLPLKKWIHFAVVLRNKELDIYVNGYLKVKKQLESLPRQNDEDLWINMFGGFEGYLSRLRYYPYAISFEEIDSAIRDGPSEDACVGSNEKPPYFADKWWYS
jgi:hypothetical protein